MIYLQLFLSYLKIGFFGFGGGYAMLSLIQNEIVSQRGWLTAAEWADIVAISQITPGPIAINSATYVGYTITGNLWGSLIATGAVCMPAITLMLCITRYYLRLRHNRMVQQITASMRPVMIGMIGAAALMLFGPESFVDWSSWLIFALCLVASLRKVNPILLILLSALAGILIY